MGSGTDRPDARRRGRRDGGGRDRQAGRPSDRRGERQDDRRGEPEEAARVGGEAPAAARVARDTLFATPDGGGTDESVAPFRFDADVARVFPDMLDRSIPGYASIVAQTGLLAARFARADTRLYDLGCSLGASALAMRAALVTRRDGTADAARTDERERAARYAGCRIVGVDNSPPMLERARAVAADAVAATPPDTAAPPLDFVEADVADCPFEPCSVVALNFTLQFVAPRDRAALLGRLRDALVPGGALVLSEKLRFADPDVEALHVELYHAFKRANGYSASEIARKRAALEDVLVPDTLAEHEARLAAAGFARTSVWFQCFNFVSLIAIR